jgi:tetratricopeptide (TPR) repeat protein
MSLDPKPVSYLYHLGQAYYVMGQYERYQNKDDQKAMEYYQQAEAYLKKAMETNRNHRPSRSYLVV